MQKEKNTLQLIQVLRGIASIFVVLLHTGFNMQEISGKEFCFGFFAFGGSGVDIFFVLSGFIITYTSHKRIQHRGKLLLFLRRRFVRIYPAYWIIIGLFLVIQISLPSFYKTHVDFELSNFLSTWFLLPGHIMVNGVSWTMSYELFFYLLFSLAFLIPAKRMAFALGMLYALFLIAMPILGWEFENGNHWTELFFSPMNVEFFLGILAAVIIPKLPGKLSLPLLLSGCVFFLGSAIFVNSGHYIVNNSFNRVVLFGVPSFLIITGLVRFEMSRSIEVHSFLLSLGEASYSLYLLHLPLVVAVMRIISRLNIDSILILHVLAFLMVAVISYGSILFYNLVEKPVIVKLNAL